MLYFVDRKKNIVRRSGENIAAAEVENALIEHKGVKAVAVLAVEDEMHDEEILACIVLMDGVSPLRETAMDIQRALVGRLSATKVPAWIAFKDELPVTGTQKVQKGSLFPNGQDPRSSPGSFDLREEKRSLRSSDRASR
jgi:crotonobetaine/carnitine-CoA ligase